MYTRLVVKQGERICDSPLTLDLLHNISVSDMGKSCPSSTSFEIIQNSRLDRGMDEHESMLSGESPILVNGKAYAAGLC